MPVTLNNNEYEAPPPPEQNTASALRQKVKSTKQMVDDALITLHSVKGVTLKQIYNYMLANYVLATLTPIRVNLIKKYINELKESEDLKNLTGQGLRGHFKLMDKEKFVRKLKPNENQRKSKKTVDGGMKAARKTLQGKSKAIKTKSNKEALKRKMKKPPISSQKKSMSVVAKQTIPIHENTTFRATVFDTPMILSSLQHSTPRTTEANNAPQAPSRATRKRVLNPPNEEIDGTPRSSLPKKKRKIQKNI